MSSKLAKFGAVGAITGTITVLTLLLLSEPASPRPLVGGKPVTFWTRQLRPSRFDEGVIAALVTEKEVAIPALIQQLAIRDRPIRDFIKLLWRKLPPSLQTKFAEPVTSAELRAGAASGIMFLYTKGLSLIQVPEPSLTEAQLLLPALTKGVHDSDQFVRLWSAAALSHLRIVAPEAIEACAAALQDPSQLVRANAVYSLGHLGKANKRAIELLKLAVTDPDPDVRGRALEAIDELEDSFGDTSLRPNAARQTP